MSHMQSVLGGQTLGMIVIAAPDFPVWTGSQHLRDQDPFYHQRTLKKNPTHGRATVQLREQIFTS